jgi:hypothetical protein
VAGQRAEFGGALSTSNGRTSLKVHRVVLSRQGHAGSWVSGRTIVPSGNAGSFQLNDNWPAGVLLPSPLTGLTTNNTRFINLNGHSALTGSQLLLIRAIGFIITDPSISQPVMRARSVAELNQ